MGLVPHRPLPSLKQPCYLPRRLLIAQHNVRLDYSCSWCWGGCLVLFRTGDRIQLHAISSSMAAAGWRDSVSVAIVFGTAVVSWWSHTLFWKLSGTNTPFLRTNVGKISAKLLSSHNKSCSYDPHMLMLASFAMHCCTWQHNKRVVKKAINWSYRCVFFDNLYGGFYSFLFKEFLLHF